MIGISDAYEIMSRETSLRALPRETLPLKDAMGRVTAAGVMSPIDLPPFDKSGMDGYAIPEGGFLDEYIVDDTIPAGTFYSRPIQPGHCVKIMTGAPVPGGIARVVPWEDTDRGDEIVKIINKSNKKNIAVQGEDLKAGDLLCPSGAILSPLTIANLALAGVDSVKVSKVPRAAVFTTGDELIEPGAKLTPGKIYDSNGPMLRGLLADCGIPVTFTGHLPDSLDESISGLRNGLAHADIVLLTGAVSKGEFDYLPEAFKQCGLETLFDSIAVKPGKPTTFATGGRKIIFGLPGNPVSSFLMFHIFVKPAIYILQGYLANPRPIICSIASEYKCRESDRVRLLPASLDVNGNIIPIDYHGSGHLLALTNADGFAEISAESTHLPAGARVAFWPLMMRSYEVPGR